MREEAHFAICDNSGDCERHSRFGESRRVTPLIPCSLTYPYRTSHISNGDSGPQRSNGGRHEFTKHKPRQGVGMAKPLSREWLALHDLRSFPRDRPAV